MKFKTIEKHLKKVLDEERFDHTQGVMYTAASLAMAHGADMKKAMYAGLLHDCAKGLSGKELLRFCKQYGIPISDAEKKSPYLLHAKVGSYFAMTKYKVDDSEIIHAIETHTTGDPNMNLLDKIIFIADFIEPHRNRAPNLAQVRKLAFEDLDLAIFKKLEGTLTYLKQDGKEIDPRTEETYAYFKDILKP